MPTARLVERNNNVLTCTRKIQESITKLYHENARRTGGSCAPQLVSTGEGKGVFQYCAKVKEEKLSARGKMIQRHTGTLHGRSAPNHKSRPGCKSTELQQ
jgi:hypothetical protein